MRLLFVATLLFQNTLPLQAQNTEGTEFWVTFGQDRNFSVSTGEFQIRIVAGNSVMIDGTNYGTIETHTFKNVQENGTITVVFVSDVGIDETALSSIKVYPNPTTGELRIESGVLEVKGVEVFDVYGR